MKKNNYFRVHLSFLLCSSLFVDFGHQAVHAEETNKVNNSEQEMVVLYKNAQGKEKIIETGNEVDYQFKNIKAVAVKVDANDIRELKKDPNISDVEPDVSFKIAEETNDKAINLNTLSSSITTMPAEESQWDFQAMNGPEMLRQGITGKGVKVAVIDTGIANHFDLNIAGGISTVSYTNSYSDDNGHGTNVAGIIGALHNGKGVVGIASDVQLYAVKALDQDGSGNLMDIAKGIDWSISNHMDIINLSLGTPDDSQLLHDMVDKAYKAGILLVGAAGNDRGAVNYPAKYDSVIAVSAVDSDKNLADFSSRGNEVEFAAPGVDIFNLNKNGGYVYMSGTSQASPHIAGFLADLKQLHPEMSAAQLRIELSKYATDLGPPGHDGLYGNGFIQYMSMPSSTSDTQFVVQQQIESATQQIELAEQTRVESDIQKAQTSIDLLPDGSEKESLQTRLNSLIQSIQDEMVLQKKIEDATNAVNLAESDSTYEMVAKAQQLIDMLPEGITKQSLQSRVDAVRSFLDNKWRETVEKAVATAEKNKLQSDIEAAQKLIDNLPKELGKDVFQARLNTVKKLLAEEEKVNILFKTFNSNVSYTELVEMQKEMSLSRTAVQSLPEIEGKTSLLSRLSSLETKMEQHEKVLKATTMVLKAEKSANNSSYIYSAQIAINLLPSGTDRIKLQNRLNAVKADTALKVKIDAATKAIAAAEKYKSNSSIAAAAVKIRTLPAGKTKTALQNRLNHAIHLKKRTS